MKQGALTALIAGQLEITAIAGRYSQTRGSQESWMRDLGRESAKASAAAEARSSNKGRQTENIAAAWEDTEKAS